MTTLSVFVQRRPNFRNRGYSPGIARFLKQSPLAFDGGDANLYRYVQNDPINAVDSTGLVVTVAGKPVDQNSDVYQGWLTNPVYKEILDKLGASKRTINFTSMNDLELELKVRQAFINCMKKICKVDYGMYGPELPFSCGFGAICTPGWINGQYRGPSPSDALDRLMANPGKSFD